MTVAPPQLTIRTAAGAEIGSGEETIAQVDRGLAGLGWRGRAGEPGWALVRLFGRLVELLLTRLNQVPDRHFLAFLNEAGISLLPPRPARTELTFTPAADKPSFIRVPAGTQVATVQTETRPEVIFETERSLVVVPTKLVKCISFDATTVADRTGWEEGDDLEGGFAAFKGDGERERVLYLGDREVFSFPDEGSRSAATITLHFTFAAPGDGAADGWQIAWRYWDGSGWADLDAPTEIADRTAGFSRDGTVEISQPPLVAETEVGGEKSLWLACAITSGTGRAHLPVVGRVQGSRSITITASKMAAVDGAFSAIQANSTFVPLDPAGEFFPLGPLPGHLDTLYVRCDEAFSKAKATAELTMANLTGVPSGVTSADLTSLTVVWEYYGTGGWTELGRSTRGAVTPSTEGFQDTTGAFTVSAAPGVTPAVSFTVAGDAAKAKVNEVEGYWVRARIVAGGYNVPALVNITNRETGSYTFTAAKTYAPLIRTLGVRYSNYGSTIAERDLPLCRSRVDGAVRDHTKEVTAGTSFAPFAAAEEGPALYLGFQLAFPEGEWIQLLLDVVEQEESSGAAVLWEYWNGTTWTRLRASDGSLGLRKRDYLGFFGPEDHQPSTEFGQQAYWLRVCPASDGDEDSPPALRAILLNTVPALNAVTVNDEVLGSSDGKGSQGFRLSKSPVLPGAEIAVCEPDQPPADELVLLEEELPSGAAAILPVTEGKAGEGVWVRWHVVSDFSTSTPASRHVTVDPIKGEIRFGDGKRGKIPPVGRDNVKALRYRTHNGDQGNVEAGSVTVLRNPSGDLANIKSVTNREAAAGGSPVETVAEVRERGPQTLKHRQRAAAAEDFIWLAREASGEVAQARCLPTRNRVGLAEPGWVTVVILPEDTAAKPTPSPALIREVRAYLEERALANLKTVRHIHVKGPEYVEVTVLAEVVPERPEEADTVELAILNRLETFLHPLRGGPERQGWELGRNVYVAEIAAEMEAVAGVDHVARIRLLGSLYQHYLRFQEDRGYRRAPFTVPGGSQVSTFDERIKVLLAESLREGEELGQIPVSGFKVGDTVSVVGADNGVLVANLTIAFLAPGRIGFAHSFILPDEADAIGSADGRLRLPLVPGASTAAPVSEVNVLGFAPGDTVSIVSQGERHAALEFIPIEAVDVCEDRVFVPEGHLVYSGKHDIDMVLE
jgi:hypothetical protein